MKNASLDGWSRRVFAKDATTESLSQDIWIWKSSCPQSLAITRAFVDFLLLDKLPLYEYDGEGIRRLLQLVEPRYEVPGRTYISQVRAAFLSTLGL
jgi:hypothetical protein